MHPTAMTHGKHFFDNYVPQNKPFKLVEIGSRDVNGSLRSVAPNSIEYIGVDFCDGKGVDIKISDPYKLPFDDNFADGVVSSSCFEHSEMFWLVFSEVLRILKPHGVFYLNVPSNGSFHRYPVDCWRFYPDSGRALVTWGEHVGFSPALLESYIVKQDGSDIWNDFVAVFVKDKSYIDHYPNRIINTFKDFDNGWTNSVKEIDHFVEAPEDIRIYKKLNHDLVESERRLSDIQNELLGVKASLSWKMTAPLRSLKRNLKRIIK